MNVLINKKIIEKWNHPEILTNGDFLEYSGMSGFSYALWPETLTFDLEITHKIYCIRFLLWDNLGQGRTLRANRKYKYRLLTSVDGNVWSVHFDTQKEGYNGWQQFVFENTLDVHYIKLHALHNDANSEFHIVEFQAFDCDPPVLNADIIVEKHFIANSNIYELGDGLPITSKISEIAKRLYNIVENNTLLNPEPFNIIISDLLTQAKDINVIEGNINSIRRTILDPVKRELEQSAKIGKYSIWGFIVGLVGFVLTILTLVIKNFQFN